MTVTARLTPAEIDALSLDQLRVEVAKADGWKYCPPGIRGIGWVTPDGAHIYPSPLNYPHDVSIALIVLYRLYISTGEWSYTLQHDYTGFIVCTLTHKGDMPQGYLLGWFGEGATEAEAICRVVLKALPQLGEGNSR